MILSAEWLAVTGRFSTGYFPFWFEDTWLDQIGQIIGRREQLPIKLGLIGGKGKTSRMRNVAFWTGFYNHTLDERIHTAKELLQKIYPEPCAEREKVEHSSRAVIHVSRGNQKFSDLYGVFREERHSNLTAEQRETLDERYFNLEARPCPTARQGQCDDQSPAIRRSARSDANCDLFRYSAEIPKCAQSGMLARDGKAGRGAKAAEGKCPNLAGQSAGPTPLPLYRLHFRRGQADGFFQVVIRVFRQIL